MNVPDATPPYPLETVEDRRFVLRAQAWACGLLAPLLLAGGLAIALGRETDVRLVVEVFGFGLAAGLGWAQAVLALRGAPRRVLLPVRVALIATFAVAFWV